jgi:hypothetical protein
LFFRLVFYCPFSSSSCFCRVLFCYVLYLSFLLSFSFLFVQPLNLFSFSLSLLPCFLRLSVFLNYILSFMLPSAFLYFWTTFLEKKSNIITVQIPKGFVRQVYHTQHIYLTTLSSSK